MHKSLNDCVLQTRLQNVLEEPLEYGGVLILTLSVLVHCIKSLLYDSHALDCQSVNKTIRNL